MQRVKDKGNLLDEGEIQGICLVERCRGNSTRGAELAHRVISGETGGLMIIRRLVRPWTLHVGDVGS